MHDGGDCVKVVGLGRTDVHLLKRQGYDVLMRILVSRHRGKLDVVVRHRNASMNDVNVVKLCVVAEGYFKVDVPEIKVFKNPVVMVQMAFSSVAEAQEGATNQEMNNFRLYISERFGFHIRPDRIEYAVGGKKAADLVSVYVEVGSEEEAARLANHHNPAFCGDVYYLGRRQVTLHSYQVPNKPHVFKKAKHRKGGKSAAREKQRTPPTVYTHDPYAEPQDASCPSSCHSAESSPQAVSLGVSSSAGSSPQVGTLSWCHTPYPDPKDPMFMYIPLEGGRSAF
eukprot:TRINITY_DN6596_c0_g2_i1.p1 TRINITY_DN6596_c0_g2~~TRINITY_DN6596_c0_g2_i1.p1  ORF type:complete len:296 (+),score=74.68 TRINITY_DN6596_c0_g2_i1:45-890(+)